MPVIYTEDGDIIQGSVTVSEIEEIVPCTVIPVVVPDSDRSDWLASYDPTSATSPDAATSRIIARAVLDALRTTETP